MRRVARQDDEATQRLFREAVPLLTDAGRQAIETVGVAVTQTLRGRANVKARRVTVPYWVFKESIYLCSREWIWGGAEFAAYYLAHELAHVVAQTGTHDQTFMRAFRELCPERLQWYETIYKPRRAATAGIVRAPAVELAPSEPLPL